MANGFFDRDEDVRVESATHGTQDLTGSIPEGNDHYARGQIRGQELRGEVWQN